MASVWSRFVAGEYSDTDLWGVLVNDLAQFYWLTDISTAEIWGAYFPEQGKRNSSLILKEAGTASFSPGLCTACGCRLLLQVRSRQHVTELLSWRSRRWTKCGYCREKEEQAYLLTRRQEQEERANREQALRAMPYADYLKTPEWQETRLRALKRARFRCQTCGGNGKLHVHHRTYIRRGCENLSDLTVLCSDCHRVFHEVRTLAEGGRALI